MKSSLFVFLLVAATCLALENSEKPKGSGADAEPKPVRFERGTAGKDGHLEKETEHKVPSKRDVEKQDGKSGVNEQKPLDNEGKPRFERGTSSGKEGHLEAEEKPRFERGTSGKDGHLEAEEKPRFERDTEKEGGKSGMDTNKGPHFEMENEGKPRFRRGVSGKDGHLEAEEKPRFERGTSSGKEGHLETEEKPRFERDTEKEAGKGEMDTRRMPEFENEGKPRFERGTDGDKPADRENMENERKPLWKRYADENGKNPTFEMNEERPNPRFFRSSGRNDKSGIDMSAETRREPRGSDKSFDADQEKPRFYRDTEESGKAPNMGDRFHPTAWF